MALKDQIKAYMGEHRGQITTKEIAEAIDGDQSSVRRALERMVESGEAERFTIDSQIRYQLPPVVAVGSEKKGRKSKTNKQAEPETPKADEKKAEEPKPKKAELEKKPTPKAPPKVDGTRGRGRSAISVEERDEFDKLTHQVMKKLTKSGPVPIGEATHYIQDHELERTPKAFQQGDFNKRYDLTWASIHRQTREGKMIRYPAEGKRKKLIDVYALV